MDLIGNLLGFSQRELQPDAKHISDFPETITKIKLLQVECSITSGEYMNNQLVQTIHEFFPVSPPSY